MWNENIGNNQDLIQSIQIPPSLVKNYKQKGKGKGFPEPNSHRGSGG